MGPTLINSMKDTDDGQEREDDDLESNTSKTFDPEAIVEGCRVSVEYKGFLYKATVKRSRLKGGIREYQIHYDGNRKSNVHWIPLSLIYEVISYQIPESKPD